MSTVELKNTILNLIESSNDKSLLQAILNVFNNHSEKEDNEKQYQPMSIEELNSEIDQSLSDSENNRVIKAKDLIDKKAI